MYFKKTPAVLQKTFSDVVWKVDTTEKKLFLTFDDGPTPNITDWVLDTLKKYQAKASFFCLAKNVEKNQDLYKRILNGNHAVGNHSYNHPNGWKTDFEEYISNVEQASQIIDSNLFRPPYGKMTPKQYKYLKKKYKIIFWDVIAADFDKHFTKTDCLNFILNNANNGSIILLHDSIKCAKKMQYCLPRVLEHFGKKGFTFDSLSDINKSVRDRSGTWQ